MSKTLTQIERALDTVAELCAGSRKWTMSIPARPNEDPDLIIAHALTDAKAEIARLTRELEEAKETLSAIRQYGSDTLSGPLRGTSDREWFRDGVIEMTRRARIGWAATQREAKEKEE